MVEKVDVTTYSKIDPHHEAQMRVTIRADGRCDAGLFVGRGIVWTIEWRVGESIPSDENMTLEQREELASSASFGLQRLRDRPVGDLRDAKNRAFRRA